MYFIRRAKLDDVPTLTKLSKMVHFINLPADRQILADKIARGRQGFMKTGRHTGTPGKSSPMRFKKNSQRGTGGHAAEFELKGLGETTGKVDLFMFVLDDTTNPGCIGTSQLISEMGTPGDPNVCFRLERREFYSPGLKTGTSHDVARLYFDESGPTEVGGLILQPSFRGHPDKLGRFLGTVRFHFMGLHPSVFSDTMLAEMMAPISPEGESRFWNNMGRRFIPLSYDEADRLCQYSREFMMSLLPKGDIFLSLLHPAARTEVGTVGPETAPARRMLERLGFEFKGYIDPFDGGPFLHAKSADIQMIRDTRWAELGPPAPAKQRTVRGIASAQDGGEFIALDQPHAVDAKGRLGFAGEVYEQFGWSEGMVVGYTPAAPRRVEKAASDAATATPPPAKRKSAGRASSKSTKPARKTKKTTKKTAKSEAAS